VNCVVSEDILGNLRTFLKFEKEYLGKLGATGWHNNRISFASLFKAVR
jgi:hypothetical protein